VVWLIGTKLVRDDWEVHNALGGPIQFKEGRTRAIRSDNTGDVAFTAAGWPSLPTKTQRCPSTGSVTHNSQISVVIEHRASLVQARMRLAPAGFDEGTFCRRPRSETGEGGGGEQRVVLQSALANFR